MDRPGLVDAAGQLTSEEVSHHPRHDDEGGQIDVRAEPRALKAVHQILGGDIPGGHFGEGAAAEAAQGRFKIFHPGLQGGVAIGQAEAVGVVKMTGQFNLAVAFHYLRV